MSLKNKILLPVIFLGVFAVCFAQDDAAKDKAREYYLQGNILYQQGKYKEAQQEFEKALDLLNKKEEPASVPAQPQAQPAPRPEKAQAAGSQEYIIGQEDVLQISVWQNPDLNQEVIVRPDGRISFPLIGDVQAEGMTITALDKDITERLAEFVKVPEVSISIKKIGGKKIIVLGEVARPGVYAVSGSQSIIEAIGLAGGFTKDAVATSVILIRGGFENPQAKRLNLSKVLNSADLRQNVRLQAEDIVFVPKKFIANVNYFLSEILDPISKGAYTSSALLAF